MLAILKMSVMANSQFSITSDYTTPSLTSAQTSYYNLITNNPALDNAQWVNLNDPMNQIQDGGMLTILIDTADLEATFTPLNVEYIDSNNYEYMGAVLDTSGYTTNDYIILEKYNGRLLAEIYLSGQYYRIFPITNQTSLLAKFNSIDSLTCANEDVEDENNCECTMSSSTCIIDLLITYPKSQYNNVSAMHDLANIAVARTNYTLINSLVKNRIRLVGVTCVVYENDSWNENLSIDTEVDLMRDLYNDTNSHLRKICDSLDPDIVEHLAIGTNFGNDYGYTESTPAISGNNFGATKINFAISQRYTFVHELGHSMGGDHQATMCPMQAYTLPNLGLQTVIYRASSPNRILNYSNPGRKHLNVATGDSEASNACVISNSGCDVGSIADATDCIPYLSRTFDTNCNPSNITVSVNLYPNSTCNTSSFKYEFKYSFDGKGFSSGCSISSNTSCTISMTNKHRIFIKVILYNSSNVYLTERTYMYNELCSNTENYLKRENYNHNNEDITQPSLDVKTRICGDKLTLDIHNSFEVISGILRLLDLNGKILKEVKITIIKGNSVSSIDINELPKGIYFASISNQELLLSSSKFVK